MSLNLKNAGGGPKVMNYKLMDPGSYPARLVQVLVLGMQPNRYNPEEEPAVMATFTYEFTDEFMLDEEGNEIKDKPRWLSETLPLRNLKSEKANSTKRYKAFDPGMLHDGDLSKCIGAPVMVTIVVTPGKGKNLGRTFENVAGVTAMREKDAQKLPQLQNEPRVFDFYEPDVQVFHNLPDYTKGLIKSALDYQGSKLESLLGKDTTPPKKEALKEELDDENPY